MTPHYASLACSVLFISPKSLSNIEERDISCSLTSIQMGYPERQELAACHDLDDHHKGQHIEAEAAAMQGDSRAAGFQPEEAVCCLGASDLRYTLKHIACADLSFTEAKSCNMVVNVTNIRHWLLFWSLKERMDVNIS